MEKKIELELKVLKDDIETVQIVLAATPKKPNEHVILLPNKYGEYKDGEIVKVVISPLQSRDSAKEPDYKAIWEEVMAAIETLKVAAEKARIDIPRVKLKVWEEAMREIEAKHTPQDDRSRPDGAKGGKK